MDKEKLSAKAEQEVLSYLSAYLEKDPILCRIWDNKKDAMYDGV